MSPYYKYKKEKLEKKFESAKDTPHFHAEYNGNKVLVDIINVKILKGYFPKRQLKLILAWAEIHKDELMQNWELARNHEALYRIAPLT